MMSLPLGFLSLLVIVFYSAKQIPVGQLANLHSFVMVFLGAIGVVVLANPSSAIRGLIRALRMMGKEEVSEQSLAQTLIELSRKKKFPVSNSHPLIQYAGELWEQAVDNEVFEALMEQRLSELNRGTEQAVLSMRNLAKYPPALGMTGTVLGLVSLFARLTPESRNVVGPALAIAMTATLYGLVLANFILMPLADRLQSMHLRTSQINEHVYKVLMLIHKGEPETIVKGELHAA